MATNNYNYGNRRSGDDSYRWGLNDDANKCSDSAGNNECTNDISEFGSVNPNCNFNVKKFISDKNIDMNDKKKINQCIQHLNTEILMTENKLYRDDPTMPEGSQNCSVKDIYKKIIRERFLLYFGGMLLGIFLGLLYLFYNKKSERSICIFIVIVFLTKMIFYKGFPKSTYMLYHLDKKEQVQAWTDIYTYMKKIWMLSFLFAIISYVLIGWSFKN